MEILYKDFATIVNNLINMSGIKIHDYSLKVAYVADCIFKQKGYNAKLCNEFIMLQLLKNITRPAHLLLEESLNDTINANSTKNYSITKGIMDYCAEFNNMPYWKDIIKNQNITYSSYKSAGSPENFPKEVFTMRFAEKIVLANENLKDLDSLLNDKTKSSPEDIEAFQKADSLYGLFDKLKTNEYKTDLFNELKGDVPNDIKMGIIKTAFISLDFKNPKTVYHSALMFQIAIFIANKLCLKRTELQILTMCGYIANIGAFATNSYYSSLTEEPTKEEVVSHMNNKIIGINEALRNVSILNYKQTLCKQFEYNDGSGYPLGLLSKDINIYAKILAIANRFCELYEDTPYCKGTNIDEIYTILRQDTDLNKLESQYVETILNNKNQFYSEISNVILIRQRLYHDLVKSPDNTDIQDYSELKLLVVEDSDLDWLVFSKILSVFKIKADRAENGQVGLDMVKSNKKYDIIFMDIQMPVMNGHEVTKLIRALPDKEISQTPIYAVTADTFSGSITTCMNSGMNGHFSKPIDVNRLMKVLEHIRLNK